MRASLFRCFRSLFRPFGAGGGERGPLPANVRGRSPDCPIARWCRSAFARYGVRLVSAHIRKDAAGMDSWGRMARLYFFRGEVRERALSPGASCFVERFAFPYAVFPYRGARLCRAVALPTACGSRRRCDGRCGKQGVRNSLYPSGWYPVSDRDAADRAAARSVYILYLLRANGCAQENRMPVRPLFSVFSEYIVIFVFEEMVKEDEYYGRKYRCGRFVSV